jgi:hypothetical protein
MPEPCRLPDFFVVGAPRCGTTAFCRYLARNPQICFSRPKEPHYFSRLDRDPTADELRRDYLDRCFGHCTPAHRAIGEGSVSYLYLPGAIERIRRLNPDARFVALVRNPLSMLPSYHLRMRFLLQEDEADFATAWALAPERAQGRSVPKRCLDARLLMYGEVAKLGAQVERLFAIAGRERTHVIVFDDLTTDPRAVYLRALAYLGVDDDGQTTFERRYESRMYRYRWLQRLLYVPATRGGKVVDTIQRRSRRYNTDGSKRPSLIKRLTRLNQVAASPEPLSPSMTATIRDALRDDVALLGRLLGRDLRHWLAE